MKILLTILALLAGTALTAQEKGVTPVATPQSTYAKASADKSALATPHSTYAVVVGISDYQDPDIPDLRFADRGLVRRSLGVGGLRKPLRNSSIPPAAEASLQKTSAYYSMSRLPEARSGQPSIGCSPKPSAAIA